MKYTTGAPFSSLSWLYITVPKANKFYDTGNNAGQALSLATSLASSTFTIDGGTYLIESNSISLGTDYADDIWAFKIASGAEQADAGKDIVLTIPITNPPCVYDLVDSWTFTIKTEQSSTGTSYPADYADVETANAAPLATGLVTTQYRVGTTSHDMAITGSLDGIGVIGASYEFKLRNDNMIPEEGVIIITVPSAVTVLSNASGFSITCALGCNTSNSPTFTWDSSGRTLTILNLFVGGAVTASSSTDQGVFFTITGWQNPNDSSTHDFYVETSFLDSATYRSIEYFSGLQITAKQGLCQVQSASITDGDTRIYAQASSYTFIMWCNHAIETDYGIRIVWPSDYIVMDRSSCAFTGYSSRYYCQIFASDNMLEVREFTDATIDAQTLITFTIDSVINPGTFDATGEITIYTIDEYSSAVDTGYYTFDQGYFTHGNITTFTVRPQDSSVGQYPVKYDFNIVPNGEVPRRGYLEINLPDEVDIINDRDFEDSCGEDLYAFTNTVISCVVTNNARTIQIKDGFLSVASTNLTDDDGLYYPPDIQFTLNGF